ncbi:MAG: DNA-binding protein [Proteobacteria bacterium]|jgi:gp16 family phage-associated protein|nr:DNA-binding protein [Pseudomonadota bacterium]
MQLKRTTTPEAIRRQWEREGKTMSSWARDHGFEPSDVSRVLCGLARGRYGRMHRIAIALGLKENPNEQVGVGA